MPSYFMLPTLMAISQMVFCQDFLGGAHFDDKDKLPLILTSLAKSGVRDVCNVAALESALDIKFEPLDKATISSKNAKEIYSQDTGKFIGITSKNQIKRGWYRRWRSGSESECLLQIEYKELEICDANLLKITTKLNLPIIFDPPSMHSAYGRYGYQFQNQGNAESILWIEASTAACKREFILNSKGDWKWE